MGTKKTSKFLRKTIQLFVLLCSSSIFGQVNNLLNFETPGFYLMPSEVGTHNDKWVLNTYLNSKIILKNLPLRSYAMSGDYQIKKGMESLYIGAGMGSMKVSLSPYQETEFYGTVAYHKIIKNHTFHVGIQPGVLFRNIDIESLKFPDQYDRSTGTYNPGIPTGEPTEIVDKAGALNLNLGVSYGLRLNKFYSKIIFAARNLNKPNLSFTQNSIIQSQQWIVETKTDYYLTNIDVIKGFLMVRNIPEKTELFLGGSLEHKLVRHNFLMNEISGGVYSVLRNNNYPNNIVMNMGIGIQNFKVGFAYSYNFIGNEASVNSFNTFELVLQFIGLNNNLGYYKVPCEIF